MMVYTNLLEERYYLILESLVVRYTVHQHYGQDIPCIDLVNGHSGFEDLS